MADDCFHQRFYLIPQINGALLLIDKKMVQYLNKSKNWHKATIMKRINTMNINRKSKLHFTMIELIIILSVITILTALLVPALDSAIGKMEGVECVRNIKELGVAVQEFTTDNKGYLLVSNETSGGNDPRGWRLKLTPYLGITITGVWSNSLKLTEGVFKCSSFDFPEGANPRWDGGYGWNFWYMGYNTKYHHIPYGGNSSQMMYRRFNFNQIPHLSQTVLLGDASDIATPSSAYWQFAYLYPPSLGTNLISDRHYGGLNYLWADLHVGWMDKLDVISGEDGDQDWYYRRDK